MITTWHCTPHSSLQVVDMPYRSLVRVSVISSAISTPSSGVAIDDTRWKSAPAQNEVPSLLRMSAQQSLNLLFSIGTFNSLEMSLKVIIILPVRLFLRAEEMEDSQ